MNRDIQLPKAGVSAAIEILDLTHLDEVLALLDATRVALPEDQKNFVLPQKPEYFEKFLNRKSGLMLGVRAKGQLVSQMVVMGPITLDEAITKNAITRNEIPFHHAETHDLIVIAKSMAVHPDWRGNELSNFMLKATLELPSARAADHVFAQISAENVRSYELFLRAGFGIVAAALDPSDGKPRFVLQRPALGFALYPTATIEDIDPLGDFSAIMRLTGREALIGRFDEISAPRLAFYAASDTAATWSDEPMRLTR